jgi:hypothetical protein
MRDRRCLGPGCGVRPRQQFSGRAERHPVTWTDSMTARSSLLRSAAVVVGAAHRAGMSPARARPRPRSCRSTGCGTEWSSLTSRSSTSWAGPTSKSAPTSPSAAVRVRRRPRLWLLRGALERAQRGLGLPNHSKAPSQHSVPLEHKCVKAADQLSE